MKLSRNKKKEQYIAQKQREFITRILRDPDWGIEQLLIYKESTLFKMKNEVVPQVEVYPSFSDFWEMYDKKVNRTKTQTLWFSLSQDVKERIMFVLPLYIQATPNKQFRKNPNTYLSQKGWEDEVILYKDGSGKKKYSEAFGQQLRRKLSTSDYK